MSAPRAFLCHSSVDKVLAERLARDLRTAGIDVWFDKWEIAPGDSLRRRIDAGIEAASFFFALLTPSSLQSEWVQTELDAAMVRRISGKCRLIPIACEIAPEQVPPTLAAVKWVRIDAHTYETGLRELIMVCHEVSSKPPVSAPPAWTQERPLPESGLSTDAQRLAALISERSTTGVAHDVFLGIDEIKTTLGLADQDVADAVDELEEHWWVKRLGDANSRIGFHAVSPTARFFVDTAPTLMGWHPAADAASLAAVAVNIGRDSVELQELHKLLGWELRRLNAATYFLVDHGGVLKALETNGDLQYAYTLLMLSPRTRRFAKGS